MKHGRFKCHIEECADCYFHRSELINHLKSKHGICIGRLYLTCYHFSILLVASMAIILHVLIYPYHFSTVQETKDFHNWMQFITWKEEEEEGAFCHFVQPTGGRINDNGRLVSYTVYSDFIVIYS